MPTVRQEAGFVFHFYSADRAEPPHVHVEGHDGFAKFWLPDTGVVSSRGYNRRQPRQLAAIVDRHTAEFLERWHEFFA